MHYTNIPAHSLNEGVNIEQSDYEIENWRSYRNYDETNGPICTRREFEIGKKKPCNQDRKLQSVKQFEKFQVTDHYFGNVLTNGLIDFI